MKRYLLFTYDECYAAGGWNDFVASFDTRLEAQVAAVAGDERIAQIIDTKTGLMVEFEVRARPPFDAGVWKLGVEEAETSIEVDSLSPIVVPPEMHVKFGFSGDSPNPSQAHNAASDKDHDLS